jgi:hypothetical protein
MLDMPVTHADRAVGAKTPPSSEGEDCDWRRWKIEGSGVKNSMKLRGKGHEGDDTELIQWGGGTSNEDVGGD